MTKELGKRELNKARKRAEIVAIATHSFLENGYAATSMSAIADELGGSKTTLWSHFSSKEELFIAVVDDRVDCFGKDMEAALEDNRFSASNLRKICIAVLQKLIEENSRRLFALVLAEGSRFPEIVEAFYTRGPSRLRSDMRDYFASHFDQRDAEELSRVVRAALLGFRSDAIIRPIMPTKAEIEAFVDVLLSRLGLDKIAPIEA
ncbi:TetR/AcrR family transcriptional regulator [Novosphingobium pentaromativorans]|uniref:Transcriptional regulator, TetR family protein n=1 Tax=Novosphingobium pentaromativorans US6-1 TaxID=1088721 RepID=G6E920_9SPHN|nr:TetR/AcrR family transcriptional regulator [Novosphingobium pentaromativorans]AIT81158.1 TetR family transcriptional regulator [Novosphingobium pentaromativorans US6-1]EHJ62244.1 transcriptional regulator, TetR family protein [Novosphingobium pentaromativorans US6-1]